MAIQALPRSLAAAIVLGLSLPAMAQDFGPPVTCEVGKDCFLQQMADMDPGQGATDPFCGSATYDGHTGLDIRILSMADIARGVPVIAMAAGTVAGTRDGEPDRLVQTAEDRKAIAKRECGNGVVIDHGQGRVTQYCHLRQGSVRVKPGDTITSGQQLGEVGASGLAQFPHVHAELRVNGKPVDLMTGRSLAEGCERTQGKSLFTSDFAEILGTGDAVLLAAGFAAGPVDHGKLAETGAPAAPSSTSPALTGWAWFANLRKGDRMRLRIEGPGGAMISETATEPLDRTKATYSAYAGKRGTPAKGAYTMKIELLREGTAIRTATRKTEINN